MGRIGFLGSQLLYLLQLQETKNSQKRDPFFLKEVSA